MKDHAFQCEHCSEEGFDVPLRESYQGQDGDLVDAQQRAQRVSQAKQMQVMQCSLTSCKHSLCMYAAVH